MVTYSQKEIIEKWENSEAKSVYVIHATQNYLEVELLQIDVTVEDDRRRQSILTAVVVRRHQAFNDGKQYKFYIQAFKKSIYEFEFDMKSWVKKVIYIS
jgi:ribosomal protein L14